MYQISCDPFHNKLVITIHRSVNNEDFLDIYEQLQIGVPTLTPKFTVINDISRYQGVEEFPVITFRKIALFLRNSGVGKVVRVVGASKIALRDFSLNSRGIDNYDVVHVPRLSDATEICDKQQKIVPETTYACQI